MMLNERDRERLIKIEWYLKSAFYMMRLIWGIYFVSMIGIFIGLFAGWPLPTFAMLALFVFLSMLCMWLVTGFQIELDDEKARITTPPAKNDN